MDYELLQNFIQKCTSDPASFTRFFAEMRAGENNVIHNKISQSIVLDDAWIITLEEGLNSVEQIVRRPRKFIAENDLLVDVSKARRTTTKTVRHLTTHSQYVQSYNKKTGEVRPQKLLSTDLEEDLAIYENRFICALINRLTRFVEQRNNDLEGKFDTYEQTNVKINSKFAFGKSNFECNVELKVNDPPDDIKEDAKNKELFDRVQTLRRRLRVLQASDFMQALSKTKPVHPPIQKTNLLNKNVDYNNCYKLWLFVSSYSYVGYSIMSKEKNLPLNGDYYDDLSVICALSLQSLILDDEVNRHDYIKVDYSEPVERDYNLVTSLSFQPDFDKTNQQGGEETINEYYFRKMKDDLVRQTGEGDIPITKSLDVNFVKFFRSISRINDEMYNELIEEQIKAKLSADVSDGENHAEVSKKSVEVYSSPLEKKRVQLNKQKERIKRRKLYLKLKWEEVERAQRVLERAEAKYDKLRKDYQAELKSKRKKRVAKFKLRGADDVSTIEADSAKKSGEIDSVNDEVQGVDETQVQSFNDANSADVAVASETSASSEIQSDVAIESEIKG